MNLKLRIEKQTRVVSLQKEALEELKSKLQTNQEVADIEQISYDLSVSQRELSRLMNIDDRQKKSRFLHAINSEDPIDKDLQEWWWNRY